MDTPATAPDAQPGSSPAPSATPAESVSGQAVLDGFSESQRTAWERTGELPDTTTIAASSAATPAEQAASTDASPPPASEPGTPERKGHKGNAETRVQELLAADRQHREEKARLQGELDALRRGAERPDARPGSSPDKPTTQADYERYLAMPDAPKFDDFERNAEHYGEAVARFSAAMGVFISDKRDQEHTTRTHVETDIRRQFDEIERASEAASGRVAKAIEADPDFRKKVHPDLIEVRTASQIKTDAYLLRVEGRGREAAELLKSLGPEHFLADAVSLSEHVDKLLLHFSTQDGHKEWMRLCQLPSRAHLDRAFGRLEARFESAGAADTSTRATPATKIMSSAPPPPTTVGSRPLEPIDPADAAIKRGDYLGYEAAENAKARAAMAAR